MSFLAIARRRCRHRASGLLSSRSARPVRRTVFLEPGRARGVAGFTKSISHGPSDVSKLGIHDGCIR